MKRVISFVLVLALVLGSFSMSFAATGIRLTDISGNRNEEAITVANDLGIITGYTDGTYKPGQAVTRAEFAAMITRALAIPDSALAGYSATSFKDTAGYGWATKYLAFCESKGIMLGDGAGNAMPGKTITVNEAITMTLRALGYTNNSSALSGTWPSNYVTLGQDLDLYDDVEAVTIIDRGSAAQIIYNALTVQKVQVDSDGETTGVVTGTGDDATEVTMLTSGLGCEAVDGVMGSDITNDSKINITNYKGLYGTAFIDDDDEIVAFSTDSELLVGDWTIDASYNVGGYLDGAKEYEFAVKAYHGEESDADYLIDESYDKIPYFVNGESAGTTSIGALTEDEYYFSVDVSGKTISNIYAIMVWDVTANGGTLAYFEDGDLDIEDLTIMNYDFAEDDNGDLDYDSFTLLGVNSLEDIKEDHVVSIYLNDDEEITRLAVGTETVTGKVKKINSDGDEFTINGNVYELSYDGCTTIELSDEGTAYLAYDGTIFDWDKDSGSEDNYAIVIGVKDGDQLDDAQIKLLTKEGNEITYDVDDDVLTTAGIVEGVYAKGMLVTFGLDEDGIIDELDIMTTVAGITGEMSASGSVFAGKSVDEDCVVFTFDGDDYDIAEIASIERDEDITPVAMLYDSGKIAVLILNENDAENTDYVYAVVTSISSANNDDDDDVQYVEGFVNGEVFEAYTDDDNTITKANEKLMTTTTAIALVVFDVDTTGEITDVMQVIVGAEDGDSDYFDDGTVVSGIITDKDGSDITVSSGGVETTVTIDNNAALYEYDDFGTDDAEYKVRSISNLKKGDTIYMWQIDEDSEYYDIVIFTRP